MIFQKIGNFVWIGENVWIDNLDFVKIMDHVCISQGSMLLCGNHNYSSTSFDLVIKPITIEEGAWIEILNTDDSSDNTEIALTSAYYLQADMGKGETEHEH